MTADGAYFHGTQHVLRSGQVLTGGHAKSNQGYGQPGRHVYYTEDRLMASFFAESANGPDDDLDAAPRVYQVQPVQGHEPDPDATGSWRAPTVKVIREVRCSQREAARYFGRMFVAHLLQESS